MKRWIRLWLLAACVCALPAGAGEWLVVAADSALRFTAEQQGAQFEGRFNRFDATFELDPDDPTTGRIEATIDMDSVDTLYDERDEALRDADWFDVAKWPEARFVTTNIRRQNDGYRAEALLTLRGATRPVTLQFDLEVVDETHLHFVGRSEISRLEFGVGQGQWRNTDWVGDKVRIEVDLLLERQPT